MIFFKCYSLIINQLIIIAVFILDGCSFHYAHTWNKSSISICWRHLVTCKERIFFRKRPCFHYLCATWNEQPSNIKTMIITDSVTHYQQCIYLKKVLHAAHWCYHICSLPDDFYMQYFYIFFIFFFIYYSNIHTVFSGQVPLHWSLM